MGKVACAECGTSFFGKGTGARYRFCSPACRHTQYRQKNRKKLNAAARKHQGAKRSARRNLVCLQCQNVYQAKRRDQSFCCVPCRDRHRRLTNPDWREKTYARNKANVRLWHQKTRQESPVKVLIEGVKKRAKKRKLAFDLTTAWGEARWTKHCELTGIPFDLGRSKLGPRSPSIDKIIPEKGYTQENCRIVLLAINWMKSIGTDEQMFAVIRQIAADCVMSKGRLIRATTVQAAE